MSDVTPGKPPGEKPGEQDVELRRHVGRASGPGSIDVSKTAIPSGNVNETEETELEAEAQELLDKIDRELAELETRTDRLLYAMTR